MLIEKMKEVDLEADRDLVAKKRNNLRSAYRKELKNALPCYLFFFFFVIF